MVVKLSLPIKRQASKWRIRINGWSTTGFFAYFPCETADCLNSLVGSQGIGFDAFFWDDFAFMPWTTAGLPSDTANFALAAIDLGSFYIDSFTIQVVYRTLR